MSEVRPEELARVFADITRDLLAQGSLQHVLDEIVRLAVRTIDGCEEAGVLLVDRRRRRFETPATTGELVRASDEAQFESDEGPCLDAARHERSFLVVDMARETRWPRYRPRAVELGIAAMMGFELFPHERVFGALDLYSRRAHAFDEHSREVGWVFASHAAVAIAAVQRGETLRAGYETRQEIGAAVGILMERHGLTGEQAFDVLRRASMEFNTKLHEVAARSRGPGRRPPAVGPVVVGIPDP
ncbi:transcriptional regulator with GAF, ATPase, and Fis domain [Spinactinospora alkalitolerans]|uniref:Transcriptional regulator with GAF, ATPase, and Fis domain n=1 Tax=Spinactinospora alkalitolerans TaxID=687207 RepID=A0A852TUT7_9ACTN|nr:GAF and ANTAR domain-containing protein [Spinactinospora alkalitolerans]NYE47067.1 transcriptional regulator with GAF, ATPase, and Fis domain [Spinactinospora alkalitolerans]